jgi:beta-glucosidase
MPWLSSVSAVLEAWYPGEQDGTATAALLFGKTGPVGHLPVTFPAADLQTPAHTQATWPGLNGTVSYSEGLAVGYRYYVTQHERPLFPFGFGLSYTRFALSHLKVSTTNGGYAARVTVTNTGARLGTAVVQAYLGYPSAANEPASALKAFAPVTLEPGAKKTISLSIPKSAFSVFLHGNWTVVPGDYQLSIGQSSADLALESPLHVG